jgi:hypothetical protein
MIEDASLSTQIVKLNRELLPTGKTRKQQIMEFLENGVRHDVDPKNREK